MKSRPSGELAERPARGATASTGAPATFTELPADVREWTERGLDAVKCGDHTAALTHFDQAVALLVGRNHDDQRLRFNRAVCLYALGKLARAQAAFVEAAWPGGGTLSALAILNAGLAAFDRGRFLQARAHLDSSHRLDTQGALTSLQDELEQDLVHKARIMLGVEPGVAIPDSNDGPPLLTPSTPAGNASLVARASALAPDDASLLMDAALAAYRIGAWQLARTLFSQAQTIGLSPDEARLARAYTALTRGGLRRSAEGWFGTVSTGVGYDSNATQLGLAGSNARLWLGGRAQGGPFSEVSVRAGVTHEAFGLAVRAGYAGAWSAYWDGELQGYSTQEHHLQLAFESLLSAIARLAVIPEAHFNLLGLDPLTPLSLSAGGTVLLGFDYGDGNETQLGLPVLGIVPLDDAFRFLGGYRLGIQLDHCYRQPRYSVGAGVGYQMQGLGIQQVAAGSAGPLGTTAIATIPLAYDGPRIQVSGNYRLASWLDVAVATQLEFRFHRESSGYLVKAASGREYEVSARVQRDVRADVSLDLTAEVYGPLEIGVSYGAVINVSNIDNTDEGVRDLDYANLNFVRHMVGVNVSLTL